MNTKEAIIGMRVMLTKDATKLPYLYNRNRYLNLSVGMVGTIIKTTGDKLGVQFDNTIWTGYNNQTSSFDNGCHEIGEPHRCAYIPATHFECISDGNDDLVNVCLYSKYKKVILFRSEKEIKSFIEEKAKESKGGDNDSHYFIHSSQDVYVKFLGRDVYTYGHMYLMTIEQYLLNINALSDYPIYEWSDDSFWNGYRMNNIKLVNHNKEYNKAIGLYKRYEQPQTEIIVTSSDKDYRDYANNNKIFYIHSDDFDTILVSDLLNKYSKNGGKLMITPSNLDKLNLDMLNVTYTVLNDDFKHHIGTSRVDLRNKLNEFKTFNVYLINRGNDLETVKELIGDDFEAIIGGVSPKRRLNIIQRFNRNGGNLVINANMFIQGGIRLNPKTEYIHINGNDANEKLQRHVSKLCGTKLFVYNKPTERPIDVIQQMGRAIRVGAKSIASDLIEVRPMEMPSNTTFMFECVYQVETDFKTYLENGLIIL